MASSWVAAAIDLYESLSAANFPGGTRPPVYFDQAPEATAAGAQLYPPYVVVRDASGLAPEYQSDLGGIEVGTLELEVYAGTLADADAAAKAVKWNGGDPVDHLGFDWGTLAIDAPSYFVSLRRVSERRALAGYGRAADGTVRRTHLVTLTYELTQGIDAG